MTVFIVIEVGAYRHRIIGVFLTKEKAVEIATKAIENSDHYHSMDICEVVIDNEVGATDFGCVSPKASAEKIVGVFQWDEATSKVVEFGKC